MWPLDTYANVVGVVAVTTVLLEHGDSAGFFSAILRFILEEVPKSKKQIKKIKVKIKNLK